MIFEPVFYIANRCRSSLDAAGLRARAERSAGLSDWGDIPFQEGFERLIASINEDANLSHQGRFVLNQHFHRLLCNNLKLVEREKRHPEIRQTELKPPLFIVGCPRTGTTLLHSLIASMPRFRALQYWELLFPVAPEGRDKRIKQAQWFTWGIDRLAPKMAAIHQLEARAPEECCFIFDHLFLDSVHHLVFDVPDYIEWYDRHDHAPSYRFHRRMLQHYAWPDESRRFALKAPRHLYCLESLMNEYPGAAIVWTHRDPAEAVPSLCSLSETARRIVSRRIDLERIGELCLHHFDRDARAGHAARTHANASQVIDVSYRRLIEAPEETVCEMMNRCGIALSNEDIEALRAKISNEQNRKRPRHRYDAGRYGLSEEGIRSKLNWYLTEFE